VRARRWAAAVIGVLAGAAAAGCGTGPGQASPSSASPTKAAAGRSPATVRCAGVVRVGHGVVVPPWRLGAIDFLSPRLAVALTAAQVPCSAGAGQGIGFPGQQVRLAVSRDGGGRWVTRGHLLPAGGPGLGSEQVVAASARRVWALTAGGLLLETRDGGGTWTQQPLPVPVVHIGRAGAALWALACPRQARSWCRPAVERLASPQGAWQRLPVPRLRASLYRLLDAVTARAAVFLVSRNGSARADLASTSDAGLRWTVRPAPRGPRLTRRRRHPCDSYAGITSAGPRRWWLMCNGWGAGGSSPKALMATTDAGRSWRTIAVVPTILATTPQPGSLPWQEVLTIVAGSARRLWLATANEMGQSTDSGLTWARIRTVNPQGAAASFDVLSPRRAWLLAPGTGLWGTSNGTQWHRIGASWPNPP
jgi:photosystem II stability/assembly factor-like uncharacterized protein